MSITTDDREKPATLCRLCKHGTVVVELRRSTRRFDGEPRRMVRVATAWCRSPRIAAPDEPVEMPKEVVECQGYEARMDVRHDVEPSRRRKGKRKRRRRE